MPDPLTATATRTPEGRVLVAWSDLNPAVNGYNVTADDTIYNDDNTHRSIGVGIDDNNVIDMPAADVAYTAYAIINVDHPDDAGLVIFPATSSARIYRAALLRAARWWLVTKAPLGVLEGDLGSIYVSRIDTEISDLLEGLQGQNLPPFQQWPTVDDVATETLNLAGGSLPAAKTAALQSALDAAIEWVTVRATQTFGVA